MSVSEYSFFPGFLQITITRHSQENEQESTTGDSSSDLVIVSASTQQLWSCPNHTSLYSGPTTGIARRTEAASTPKGNQNGPCEMP